MARTTIQILFFATIGVYFGIAFVITIAFMIARFFYYNPEWLIPIVVYRALKLDGLL